MIDPATLKVVDKFNVGLNPQHVVPSWDLKTLWVANNAENTTKGSLTPIDPLTGKPGKAVEVDDPYNMYFTPDGKEAIVVAEALQRLDFRDPQTMALKSSLPTPECGGINHADFSIDGRYAIFTCEFGGSLAKIDMVERKVLGYLKLSTGQHAAGHPRLARRQDVLRRRHDGRRRVRRSTATSFKEIGFIPTGMGTHGLYPSRDGKKLYVANRGSNKIHGNGRRQGQRVGARLRHQQGRRRPGRSPAAAAPTWATSAPTASSSGSPAATTTRSTSSTPARGEVTKIPVGKEPHGLTVWPQPGRYSLGHTGNMR